jgi:HPt (histidine-containing phosphotransfer) domain-containing protein
MSNDGLSVLESAVIDALRALNEEGQPDVVKEVLGLFVTESAARLDAIEAAVRAHDAAALQRSAHTLKGASGAIGAVALQTACRTLEDMGKHGSFDEAPAAVESMRHEYRRVLDAINQLL